MTAAPSFLSGQSYLKIKPKHLASKSELSFSEMNWVGMGLGIGEEGRRILRFY